MTVSDKWLQKVTETILIMLKIDLFELYELTSIVDAVYEKKSNKAANHSKVLFLVHTGLEEQLQLRYETAYGNRFNNW